MTGRGVGRKRRPALHLEVLVSTMLPVDKP
jgi:hypothetical protein